MRLQSCRIKNFYLSINWPMVMMCLGTMALILGRMTQTLADPDLWGYMSFGRLFWNQVYFPYHDVFSYTPNQDLWVYHEWLTGVIFYPLYTYAGAAGLQGFKFAIGLGTAFLIYQTARIRGASMQTAVICLILISPFFSFAYSPVRAQVFTAFFFVLTFYILEKTKHTGRYFHLWWLVPVFLLWANLHGGFVAGLGLVGLFAVCESVSMQKAEFYWLALLPSTLITLVNPYGIQYWIYLKQALLMPRPDIDEWHSVFFVLQNGDYSTNILIFLILFLLACLMLLTARSKNISDILIVFVTAFLAFKHVRHQSLFFLVMGCCAPFYFTNAWNVIRASRVQKNTSKNMVNIFCIIIFAFLFFIFGFRFVNGHPFTLALRNISTVQAVDYNYPIGAVEFIRKHGIRGNILSEFSWGEYILWSLPDSRVAMDGRYETLYTETAAHEYFDFMKGGRNWRDYLNKYPHHILIFHPSSTASALLHSEPNWLQAYNDPDCILYMRK